MKKMALVGLALAVAAGSAKADNEDFVYISLPDIHEVHKLDLQTGVMTLFTEGIQNPLYFEIGADGCAYVGDFGLGAIWKVYPDGSKELLSYQGLLGAPLTVAIHPVTGDLYVTDAMYQRIVIVDPVTGDQTSFSENSDHGLFYVPGGLTWGRDGNIYMTDHGTHHIIRIYPDGTAEKLIDGPAAGFQVPAGIEADHCGNLFVCLYINGKIVRVREENGEWEVFCDSPLLHWPNDIEIAPNGGLFCANEAGQRLVHVDSLGQASLVHQDNSVGGWLGVAVPGEHPDVMGGMTELGVGTAGKDGFVPRLRGLFDPSPGMELGYVIDHAAPSTGGLLLYGLEQSAYDVWGGTLWVDFSAYWGWIPFQTSAGPSGQGEKRFRFNHPDGPALEGAEFVMQAVLFDSGNPYNKSMTNGLAVKFGLDPNPD